MATLDDYEIIKDLGAGAFSTVKLGKHSSSGKMYALKIIKDDALDNEMTLKTFKNEIETMQEISHPNIINLIKSSGEGTLTKENGDVKNNVVYLTLELATGGELFDFIAQTG